MSKKDPDYVGYGHPPRANQYQAGQSGNKNGRPPKPKGERSIDSYFLQELRREVKVNGKRVKLSDLFANSVLKAATQGDSAAIAYMREGSIPTDGLQAELASVDSQVVVQERYDAVRADVERRLAELRSKLRELQIDDRLVTAALGAPGFAAAETAARRTAAIAQLQAMGVPENLLQQLRARAERLAGGVQAVFPAAS